MGQKLVITTSTTILLFTGVLLGYILSQLVKGNLPLNLVTFLGTFSLIVIFGTIYYVLFWEFRRHQPAPRKRRIPQREYRPDEFAAGVDLRNRLVAMFDGDTEAAEKLVAKARQEEPGMNDNWYWEKAIADFEQGRR
jgi:uncharacterized protein HemY